MEHDHLANSIIYIASRLEAVANRYVFAPQGLSSASVKIMGLLCCQQALTPSEILEKIGGTKSNISQRLNFLEKEGLIERTYAQYANDKRRVAIALTKKGNIILQEMRKRLKAAQISLESNFSQKELTEHRKFLEKINGILDMEEKELANVFNQF